MAGFGPPPKNASQRRRRNLPLGGILPTRLPAAGRIGAPPKWPLPPHPDTTSRVNEAAKWRQIWHTPQAVAWEQLQCFDVVARWVRLWVEINRGGAMVGPPILAEIRQLEDRLGMSPQAMLRQRWTVEGDDETVDRTTGKVLDIRERLKAVE
ncbi:MAG: hypothetical protein ACREM8_07000 [Vulcanimicrobiaceae bacterium]